MEQNSILVNLGKGTIWSSMGAGLNQGGRIISLLFLTWILGQTEFGKYSFVLLTIQIFSTFAGLSIGLVATKYISEFLQTDNEKVGRILGICVWILFINGFLFSTIIFIVAPWITQNQINTSDVIVYLKLASGIVFLTVVFETLNGILAGFQDFRKRAIVATMMGVLTVTLHTMGAWFWAINGALLANYLTLSMTSGLGIYFIYQYARKFNLRIQMQEAWKEINILWNFNLPAVLSLLVNMAIVWLSNLVLIGQNNGFTEIAIFNICWQIKLIVQFIPGHIAQVSLPIMSKMVGQKKHILIRKAFISCLLANTGISIVMSLPMIMFASQILSFFGQEYCHATMTLVLLIICGTIYSSNNIIVNYFLCRGWNWRNFGLNIIWALTFVIVISLLGRDYLNAYKMAISLFFAYLTYAFIAFISVWFLLIKNNDM